MLLRGLIGIAFATSLGMCATEPTAPSEEERPPDVVGPDGLELMTAPTPSVDIAPLPDPDVAESGEES